jgi:four helix bundle protein
MNMKKYDLEERLLDFAVRIIDAVENLPDNKPCNYLGTQLLRSGTSPALNYGEAQAAESRNDFIHKFKIILKELRETLICSKILQRKSWLPGATLIRENNELISIFVKSVITAKSKDRK